MARMPKVEWLPPDQYTCKCAKLWLSQPHPGYLCEHCGTEVSLWMTDEEFGDYCRENPLPDEVDDD